MTDSNFLSQIVILFGTAVAVAWLFRIARAPSILGFLITGILIGPSSAGWIERESVTQFAEIGVILLLFTVGVELSPEPLIRAGKGLVKSTAIIIPGIIVLTTIVGMAILDQSFLIALLLGIACSNSSTPIALKQLSDRNELRTLLGTLTAGSTLLQDTFLIVAMALMPLFAPGVPGQQHSTRFTLIAFGVLVAVVLVARRVLPYVISQLLARGGHELTALFAVLMAAGGAWLASIAGWSPALGACITGLLLANADVRHQIVADIVPFRDVFNALFFISMGMLVNVDYAVENAGALAFAVVAAVVLKAGITACGIRLAGWPGRIGFQVGCAICTVSEFAYLLLFEAERSGMVTGDFLEATTVFVVGTMIVGAAGLPFGTWLVFRRGEPGSESAGEEQENPRGLSHHVIVVGYGVNGQNLAHVLTRTHIPYCVVELDQRFVDLARERQVPIIAGDAARAAILDAAGLRHANALVVGINDIQATRRIVSLARSFSRRIHIVVRTPYVSELDELTRRGADVVVPADFEASVRIFSHVLEQFGVPQNILAAQIAAVRAGGYGALRGVSTTQESLEDLLKVLNLSATQTYFLPEHSPAVGNSLKELDLRNRTGVSVIAVVRDRNPVTSLDADFRLAANDVLVLVGSHADLQKARELLHITTKVASTPPIQRDPGS